MVQLIYCQFQKHKTPIKFIISGMTAAGVDFFCIYFLHSVLLVNVVLSATIAYAIAFFVSFCLQKFWTFSDNDKERMSGQMILYLIVGLINLSINAGLIYLLIEKYDTWPIVKNIFSQSRLLHPLISSENAENSEKHLIRALRLLWPREASRPISAGRPPMPVLLPGNLLITDIM